MVLQKVSEGVSIETWADFAARLAAVASGDQPAFAFFITSPPGRRIAWAATGADVLALAAELDLAADALRRRGAKMAPEPTGKPN
jgi:hypothetical protein